MKKPRLFITLMYVFFTVKDNLITIIRKTTKVNSKYFIWWNLLYIAIIITFFAWIIFKFNSILGYVFLGLLVAHYLLDIVDSGHDVGWYRRYKDKDYDKKPWWDRNGNR